MTADRLSLLALNRATLDRQLLLHRHAMTAQQAVEHLGGLQAQAPLAPYVGLWTRLAGFRHQELHNLVAERALVRAHLLRNTVHLLTAGDFLTFRPLFQSVMERALTAHFGRNLTAVDPAELREVASALLAETPLTRTELGRRLAQRWPGHDPGSLAYAATHLLQLVQVPPRGLWGASGPAAWFLAAAWLAATPAAARPLTPREAAEELVLRYLGAFGPATVKDIQAWSGLSRLREVTEGLGGRLRTFTGPDGAGLLDLPDAPHPDEEATPAPPRFLPEYDNLLLSFADRSRVIPHGRPVPLPPGNGASTGTLLVDGFWQADWKITRGRDRAVLEIQPFTPLGGSHDAIAAEGTRLLEFAAPAAAHDVRFAPLARGGNGRGTIGRSAELRSPPTRAGRSANYGRGMDDTQILTHINELIATEHKLRAQYAAGELTSAQEHEQLRSAEEALDQCWDLLRQRRARREFGENPDETVARPVGEVEGYQQ